MEKARLYRLVSRMDGIAFLFIALSIEPTFESDELELFEDCREAIDRGEEISARNICPALYEGLRRAASRGDADSQNGLGVFYRFGLGVPQDDAESIKWFRRAAEQGDAVAQINLGSVLMSGLGGERDSVEAVIYFRGTGVIDEQKSLFSIMVTHLKERRVRLKSGAGVCLGLIHRIAGSFRNTALTYCHG